jgi:hypothetical protein
MLEKSELACMTRMGEYVRIDRATILEKSEWACTSRNERVCTDRMRHYA